MNLKVIWTSKFKKDYKLAIKRGLDINLLDDAIRLLSKNGCLPEQYNDHPLHGDFKGFRECHIEPDWLLIYAIENNMLYLTLSRTVTHSDLLKISYNKHKGKQIIKGKCSDDGLFF